METVPTTDTGTAPVLDIGLTTEPTLSTISAEEEASAAYPSPVSPASGIVLRSVEPDVATPIAKIKLPVNDATERIPKHSNSRGIVLLADEQLPDEDCHRSVLSKLWLLSRLRSSEELAQAAKKKTAGTLEQDPYRSPKESRPITRQNIKIVLAILPLVLRRYASLFWADQKRLVVVYLISQVVDAFLPTARMWIKSRLLNLVQKGFTKRRQVSRREVLNTVALSIGLKATSELWVKAIRKRKMLLKARLRYSVDRPYLHARLSLSIPAMSSPYVSDVMHEAGIFAGDSQCEGPSLAGCRRPHEDLGPLGRVFGLMTSGLALITQASILVKIIASTITDLSVPSLTLVLLSLAPPVMRASKIFRNRHYGAGSASGIMSVPKRVRVFKANSLYDLGEMAKGHGSFKQETVLFGLRDWIMTKWDQAQQGAMEPDPAYIPTWRTICLDMGEHVTQTAFSGILASNLFPTPLTLGDMNLYRDTTSSLLWTIEQFQDDLDDTFQTIFHFAAFCEATDHPELLDHHPRQRHNIEAVSHTDTCTGAEVELRGQELQMVDYDDHRSKTGAGMRIEARNLSFTYPGQHQPTLRDINLTLEPGQTLAVVGYNGGGKTTLVKTLMGLYSHGGELLINDILVEKYTPESLHRRQSCLFQDFAKYTLTLKDNVGLGWVDGIEDKTKIAEAMEKGGAREIFKKVGWGGKLHKSGTAINSRVPLVEKTDKPKSVVQAKGDGETKNEKEVKITKKVKKVEQNRPTKKSTAISADIDGHEPRKQHGESGIVQTDENVKADDPPRPEDEEAGAVTTEDQSKTKSTTVGTEMDATAVLPSHDEKMIPEKAESGVKPSGSTKKGAAPRAETAARSHAGTYHGLSGGQWQRIALSRAFMRVDQADLVVFDEPSAALDPKAEHELFNRIHSLSHQGNRKITTIYISHRFNTVRRADLIAFVDGGTITELGSHDQLMANNGKYCEMYNLSKEGFA